VKKIVIVKVAATASDEAELKEGTLSVKTSTTDDAISKLHGVLQAVLDKAL